MRIVRRLGKRPVARSSRHGLARGHGRGALSFGGVGGKQLLDVHCVSEGLAQSAMDMGDSPSQTARRRGRRCSARSR